MIIAQTLQDSLLLSSSDTLKVLVLSKNPQEAWSQYIPWIIALLAVFFGPIIQWLIGKRQTQTAKEQLNTQRQIAQEQLNAQTKIAQEELRASVRSNNRQQWVNTLRDQISDFAAQLGGLSYNLDETGKPIDLKIHFEKAERLIFIQTKIQLLLNPTKPDHKEIIDMVDEARQAGVNGDKNRIDLCLKEVTAKSQVLFKLTWERIKKLE